MSLPFAVLNKDCRFPCSLKNQSIRTKTQAESRMFDCARLELAERCQLDMNKGMSDTWVYIALASAVGVLLVLWPVVRAFWKVVCPVQNAQTPEARLQITNLWTEIQQSKEGGSFQMMRMADGNIIFLSIAADTAKVFVTPRLDNPASFVEYASFPIQKLIASTREQQTITLDELRAAVGWPTSASELRQTLENVNLQ